MELKNLRLSYTLLHIKFELSVEPLQSNQKTLFLQPERKLSPATVHTLLLLIILFFFYLWMSEVGGGGALWDYLSPAVAGPLARE